MGTKYIENPGPDTIYVGGKMIPPGEGRDIDTALLPAELADPVTIPAIAVEKTLADLVAELRTKSVKLIAAELPQLTNEGLEILADQEGQADTPRTSLLGAIRAEQLRRAQEQQDVIDQAAMAEFEGKVKAAYDAALKELSAEELAAIGEEGLAELRKVAEEKVREAGTVPPAA